MGIGEVVLEGWEIFAQIKTSVFPPFEERATQSEPMREN